MSRVILEIEQTESWNLISASDEKLKSWGIDPNRGFMLLGRPGVGKTTILESHRDLQKKKLPILTSKNVSRGEIKYNGFSFDHKNYDVYLDDLGIEELKNNEYGQISYPILDFLEDRYEIFVKIGIKTHVSSNLNLHELKSRYKERFESRMYAMFNIS